MSEQLELTLDAPTTREVSTLSDKELLMVGAEDQGRKVFIASGTGNNYAMAMEECNDIITPTVLISIRGDLREYVNKLIRANYKCYLFTSSKARFKWLSE